MKEFKVFIAAFFAFLCALMTYRLIVNYHEQKAIEQVFNEFINNTRSPKTFEFTSPKQPSTRSKSASNQLLESAKKSEAEQKKLSETEQVCNFWKQAYNNENNDKHHQRVLETCPEYQKKGF